MPGITSLYAWTNKVYTWNHKTWAGITDSEPESQIGPLESQIVSQDIGSSDFDIGF